MSTCRPPSIWVLGLAGGSFGLLGGLFLFVIPQALSDRHVPEPTIATLTALTLAPGFYSFVFTPILDVGFSRRTYSWSLFTVAALLAGLSTLLLDNVPVLKLVCTLAYLANQLAYSALGGWLSTVCPKEQENELSAWLTVSNVGGFGSIAVVGGEILRATSPILAALNVAAIVVLPMITFFFIPAQAPNQRLVSESVQQFAGDIGRLLTRRSVLLAIALFVAPCATFSLTNMLAGFGADFRTSAHLVGLMGGVGSMVAGIAGSLMLTPLARRYRLIPLYLGVGIVGSAFTLVIAFLPHAPLSFLLLALGEAAFQSLAIACSVAITFESIGPENPLAATNYGVLISAFGVPISYMLLVDGWAYGHWGVGGALMVDALAGIGACLAFVAVTAAIGGRRVKSAVQAASE